MAHVGRPPACTRRRRRRLVPAGMPRQGRFRVGAAAARAPPDGDIYMWLRPSHLYTTDRDPLPKDAKASYSEMAASSSACHACFVLCSRPPRNLREISMALALALANPELALLSWSAVLVLPSCSAGRANR